MKKRVLLLFVALAVLVFVFFPSEKKTLRLSGDIFGTTYSIIYFDDDEQDLQKQVDSVFAEVNRSMSTYLPNSIISKFNRNEEVIFDDHFIAVYLKAKEIHRLTNGAFDPTIGIVVNAWDFGPEGNLKELDSMKIDSLMHFVGFDKIVGPIPNLTKKDRQIYLDFNAIAKGYGVDAVGEMLEFKNIDNYLVEIGGEIRVKGQNIENDKPWMVGLEEPRFDGTQAVLKAIALENEAMATSGTYRKFKIDDNGNRYSHIIDTNTGYPSKTNILSVSVIAEDCMTADAYATAFKTMGIDNVKSFLKAHPELKAFIIFENDSKSLETLAFNGFPEN